MITFDFPKYDCCVIDFETATNYTNSACSVGIAVIKNNEIVDTFYSLIQPPNNEYDTSNISIHGITPEDTKNCSTFGEVWQSVLPYIENSALIAAYNAQFDMSVLCESLSHYNIPVPFFNYFDTQYYRMDFEHSKPRSLKERADMFGIEIKNHHNALEDAIAAANIIIRTTTLSKYNSIFDFIKDNYLAINQIYLITAQRIVGSKKKKTYSTFSPKIINEILPSEKSRGHILENKVVVFTGEFNHTKEDLAILARNYGAIIRDSISSKTNYLVEGTQQKEFMDENGFVSKQRKAIELINNGIDIKRISETQLLDLCK